MEYQLNFITKPAQDPSMHTTRMRVNGKFYTETTGTHPPFVGDQLAWFLRDKFSEELKGLSNIPALSFQSVNKKGGTYTDITEFINAFKKSQEEDFSPVYGGAFQIPVVNHGYEIDDYLSIFRAMGYTTEVVTATAKSYKIIISK